MSDLLSPNWGSAYNPANAEDAALVSLNTSTLTGYPSSGYGKAAKLVYVVGGALSTGTTNTSGAPLGSNYYAAHITTNTTTTPTSATAYVAGITICVTSAGTNWVLNIKNKESTAKTIYANSGSGVSVGTTFITPSAPFIMTSGIDIVTVSGTPGVMDVFITYYQ